MSAKPMSTAQKGYLLVLMRKAEYDTHTCSTFHQGLAKCAHVNIPKCGELLDDWIAGFDSLQASRVIDRLKMEAE